MKILGLFPHPGVSHFHFFHPIMRGLAEAGHDVTVVSHFPDKNAPENYKDLKLPTTDLLTNAVNLEWFAHRPSYQHFQEFFLLYQWGLDACENSLNSSAIRTVLKQKFDVILMEQFNSDCMMGVAWKLNAPVIGLSSCVLMPWHYDRLGSPLIPSYMPGLFLGYSDDMSYSERASNWVALNVIKLMYKHFTLKKNDEIVRRHLKDDNMPHLSELVKSTSMMFVNSHYSFGRSRPNPPTIIELGGVHIKEEKPLDPEIKAVLDSAKNGVIYVSWGSMIRADSLPVDKRNSLLKAFGSFKQKVVWKWENNTLPDQPNNVYIRKWMPQRDILCHPNVRVFVSHGGLGSSESAYCGVPMVLTPMYGDQFHNSAAAKARGMGWILPYEDITEETVKTAINNALSSTSRDNAKKVSHSYRNRPQTPMETAIWWVECVAATRGAPLLQSHSMHLSIVEYYSLDVLSTIIATLIIVISPWFFIIRKCLGKSKSQKYERKPKKE